MKIQWKAVNGYQSIMVESPCFDEAYDLLLRLMQDPNYINLRILDKPDMRRQWHTAGGTNTCLLIQAHGGVNFIRIGGPTYSIYQEALVSMNSVFNDWEELFNQALDQLEQKL